jgi:hypothetical protein
MQARKMLKKRGAYPKSGARIVSQQMITEPSSSMRQRPGADWTAGKMTLHEHLLTL